MKKKLGIVLALILLVCMFTLPAQAAGTIKVSLSANKPVLRGGDVVTVSVKMSGVSSAGGVMGAGPVTVGFDTSKFTYVSGSAKIGDSKPESDLVAQAHSGNVILLYEDPTSGSRSFTKDATLATLQFRVKDGINSGSASFSLSASGFADRAGKKHTVNTAGMSVTFAQALSGENNLASLSIGGVTLEPAFNPSVTAYTASVPFATEKLTITAKAKDEQAKISQSNPALIAGGKTTLSVTVTAASGDKKVYTIVVSREQDPNYVASAEGALSSLRVDGFYISPAFSPTVTQYLVWLPYETERVEIWASAENPKTVVEINGTQNLIAGMDNYATVLCKAEDGSQTLYTVVLRRAAAHGADGAVDVDIPANANAAPSPQTPGAVSGTGIPWWGALLCAVGGLAAGGVGVYFLLPIILQEGRGQFWKRKKQL